VKAEIVHPPFRFWSGIACSDNEVDCNADEKDYQ
jgi:hypothetical protein